MTCNEKEVYFFYTEYNRRRAISVRFDVANDDDHVVK
jgi:hypothetical protein